MKIQKEYIIVVNGRPYFSVLDIKHLSAVIDDAKARFGVDSQIEVFMQTTEPYAPEKNNND
ncbi:hypothetical protein [Alistipes finegoldii]